MAESTLIEVSRLYVIVGLLEKLSIKLQEKQLWDCLTDCEQIKASIQKWISKDEEYM